MADTLEAQDLIKRILYWRDYITINIFWFGINTVTGSITPVILPFLIALYVPGELKNTYLANIRVASLALRLRWRDSRHSLPLLSGSLDALH
jgi:hypothetical protein